MDLNDLKKTWNLMPSGQELDEGKLREMLGSRTKNLIECIDRNIKIGFAILLGLIVLFSFADSLLPAQTVEKYSREMPTPNWLIILSAIGNILILSTFIYFAFKYYKVKRSCDVACNLKDTLKKIISTLELYKRLFYVTLAMIIILSESAFIAGMFNGTQNNAASTGIRISEIGTEQILIIIFVTIIFISLLGGGIFLFLRWGFRKLYGNYIHKLKATLKELEEIKE